MEGVIEAFRELALELAFASTIGVGLILWDLYIGQRPIETIIFEDDSNG